MAVTIWCAIGMDREGDFAGKTGSRDAPDHDGVSGKQAISRKVRSLERFEHQV